MEYNLNDIKKLSVRALREFKTKELIGDLIICLKGDVAINNWIEDTRDEPSAYPYTTDELKTFLLSIELTY